VTLDASASYDPDIEDDLSFEWKQIDGPQVELSDPTAAKPTFTSPDVQEPTDLTFEVSVSDGEHVSTDTVTVTVNPLAQPRDDAQDQPEAPQTPAEDPVDPTAKGADGAADSGGDGESPANTAGDPPQADEGDHESSSNTPQADAPVADPTADADANDGVVIDAGAVPAPSPASEADGADAPSDAQPPSDYNAPSNTPAPSAEPSGADANDAAGGPAAADNSVAGNDQPASNPTGASSGAAVGAGSSDQFSNDVAGLSADEAAAAANAARQWDGTEDLRVLKPEDGVSGVSAVTPADHGVDLEASTIAEAAAFGDPGSPGAAPQGFDVAERDALADEADLPQPIELPSDHEKAAFSDVFAEAGLPLSDLSQDAADDLYVDLAPHSEANPPIAEDRHSHDDPAAAPREYSEFARERQATDNAADDETPQQGDVARRGFLPLLWGLLRGRADRQADLDDAGSRDRKESGSRRR
ncbi:MAG: hypothetical protein D6744_11535, partial [Planctomycetota bacterium]